MSEMDQYLQNVYNTQDWLKCVSSNGGWGVQEKSLAALRATLQLLRKKLPVETSAYLGDQLPPMIREMYYKETDSTYKKNVEEKTFLDSMGEYLKPRTDIEPEEAAYAVFKTLAHKIPKEAISKIRNKSPKNMQSLWD